MTNSLITRDLDVLWHPCSQMKDYETFPPIPVIGASGSHLHLTDDQTLIDAISSWWCKSLGHRHPRLQAALIDQAGKFEHVILANTTSKTIVECSEAILSLSPAHDKVTYTSDGSCAVEMALKMAVHAQQLQGRQKKNKFLALKNGYHGETALTLSVSDVGLYKTPYQPLLQEVPYIDPMLWVNGPTDPRWHEPLPEKTWQCIANKIQKHLDTTAAIIFEPILQGSGGMTIYHPDFLVRLRQLADENDILLIADEIMTGVGRTGKALACEHAGIHADLVCLSKGLTSGYLPLSAVLIPNRIYDLFYDDYATGKAFLHSHTHTGNALAARVATETLHIMQDDNIYQRATETGELMYQLMREIADESPTLGPVRQVGCMAAMDLVGKADLPRAGYKIYLEAIKLGALLRPLGNTIYWMPPLNIDHKTLRELQEITARAIHTVT